MPALLGYEIDDAGKKKYPNDARIEINDELKRATGVLLAEAAHLQFTEEGCERLISIVGIIGKRLPSERSYSEIRKKLAEFYEFQGLWQDNDGQKQFNEIQSYLLKHMHHLM